MFPYIVADVGGTNARFGLVTGKDATTAGFEICERRSLDGSAFDSFESCLHAYLASLGSIRPVSACIAIAGPISGDRVLMTNRNWQFSRSGLRQRLQLDRLEVVNDFAALAYSTLYIGASDLRIIQDGVSVSDTPRAIVGPGTGLGVAALVPTPVGWQPVPGEGGHIAFSPPKGKEAQILEIVRQEVDHVSAETLLSGPGLTRLHHALAVAHGREVESLTAEQITTRAIADTDATCRETLGVFCHLLGSIAGDFALIYGARGGAYIGGGILPRIEGILAESTFLEGFQSKGLMSGYLAHIPIYLIKGDSPALIGAAGWLYDQQRTDKRGTQTGYHCHEKRD
ncbi:MAG: glucokinase [Pseudomonadales bacterium]